MCRSLHRKTEEEDAVGATYCERLDDLLQQSDFVMVAVSLTPQTRGLIGRRELRLMKPTAILVNIGRGAAPGVRGPGLLQRPRPWRRRVLSESGIAFYSEFLVSAFTSHEPQIGSTENEMLQLGLRSGFGRLRRQVHRSVISRCRSGLSEPSL